MSLSPAGSQNDLDAVHQLQNLSTTARRRRRQRARSEPSCCEETKPVKVSVSVEVTNNDWAPVCTFYYFIFIKKAHNVFGVEKKCMAWMPKYRKYYFFIRNFIISILPSKLRINAIVVIVHNLVIAKRSYPTAL